MTKGQSNKGLKGKRKASIVHGIANRLPPSEFRLADQSKRSSSSVPDNIAEGYGSFYLKDKLKGMFTARKEARETQNHLKSTSSKGFISRQQETELVDRYEGLIIGMNKFIQYLNSQKDRAKK